MPSDLIWIGLGVGLVLVVGALLTYTVRRWLDFTRDRRQRRKLLREAQAVFKRGLARRVARALATTGRLDPRTSKHRGGSLPPRHPQRRAVRQKRRAQQKAGRKAARRGA